MQAARVADCGVSHLLNGVRDRCSSFFLLWLDYWPHVPGRSYRRPTAPMCGMMSAIGPFRSWSAASSLRLPWHWSPMTGTRYPAAGIALVSGPHVLYNPPPSVGFGIGGFGFSGCCSGFGSGIGVGLPVGGPTPAEVSDQYVASALIPLPPDYASNWSRYHVEVSAGAQPMNLAAPAPTG